MTQEKGDFCKGCIFHPCSECDDETTTLDCDYKETEKPTMAELSKQRPSDFKDLSPAEQWMIDKKLGILDWDGKQEEL